MKYAYLTLLIILSFSSFSQNTNELIDSLRIVLQSADGLDRIRAEHNLATLLTTIDFDEADSLSSHALEESKKLNYQEGIVMASIVQASLANLKSDLNRSKRILNETLEIAVAMEFTNGLSKIYTALGSLYLRKGEYILALEYLLEGLKAAEELGQFDVQLTNLMNIGLIKQRVGSLDEAENYLRRALNIGLDHNLEFRTGQVYINLGVLEFVRKNVGLSIEYNSQALEIFRRFNDKLQEAICLQNLGFAQASLGNFREANELYDQTIALREQVGDRRGLSAVLLNKARLNQSSKDYNKAIDFADQALRIAQDIKNARLRQNINQFLYQFYQSQNNPVKALDHFTKYSTIKDSLVAASNQARIAELTAEFEFEKQEQALQLQDEELSRLDEQRVGLGLIVLALLVIIVLTLVLFRMRLSKIKFQEQLSEIERKNLDLQKKQLSQDLKLQGVALKSYAEQLSHKNEIINKIKEDLNDLRRQQGQDGATELLKLANGIEGRSASTYTLEEFRVRFNEVYEEFIPKVINNHEHLTQNELDLCIFLKLNLTYKDIAQIQSISYDGVKKAVQRLYKKFDKATADELRLYLISL